MGKKAEADITAVAPQSMCDEDRRALEMSILRALPDDLRPDLVEFWAKNPETLEWKMRRVLEEKVVTCELDVWANEGVNVNDLVQWGKYTHYNPLINPSNFPVSRIYGPRNVKLEFIDGRDVWARNTDEDKLVAQYINEAFRVVYGDVLAEARVRGLEQPTFVDALYFGKDCLGQFADGRPIAFLHEPRQIRACECRPDWRQHVPMGESGLIIYYTENSRRRLDLTSPTWFFQKTFFPFVRSRS